MSLVRLLASGKSLVDLKGAARYRMSNPGALPKFGGRKNPFREMEPEAADQTQEDSGQRPEERVQGSGLRSEGKEGAEEQGTEDRGQRTEDRDQRAEVQNGSKVRSDEPKSGGLKALPAIAGQVVASTFHGAGSWAAKIRQILPWRRSGWIPKAQGVKTGIQGELSLEQVQVVCSDLSDADLEVAPILKAEECSGGKEKREIRSKLEPKI